MSLDLDTLGTFASAAERLAAGFDHLPDAESPKLTVAGEEILNLVAERLHDNYPYQHPLYAGQMLKPPHPVARLAYMLALWINPNNHALDGGRASSAMEKEAVAALARMVGWSDDFIGHLTSGGTVANLEALWIAAKLRPGKRTLASEQAHYTHSRLTGVLDIPFAALRTDDRGRIDLEVLERELAQGDVGTVVVTLGTTGLGMVDPLAEVTRLKSEYDFHLHVDAAYGGYFRIASGLAPTVRTHFEAMPHADSIVIDPHKHGLQPYGCGAVLFRDPSVRAFYAHESGYTYFSSDELHLGEITLECSRAGASAVALWATQQLLPMIRGGEFAGMLDGSLRAARAFAERLDQDARSLVFGEPELDIVIWAPVAQHSTEVSALSSRVFEAAAARDLHLATMSLDRRAAQACWPSITFDSDSITVLRSVMMKPEHENWQDEIWVRYQAALDHSFDNQN